MSQYLSTLGYYPKQRLILIFFCIFLGHDALSFGQSEGFVQLKEVFAKAPTRASWDVHQTETTPKQPVVTQGKCIQCSVYGLCLFDHLEIIMI